MNDLLVHRHLSLYHLDNRRDTLFFLVCYCKFHHYHQNEKITKLLEIDLYTLFLGQTYYHIELLFTNNVYMMRASKGDPCNKPHQ